MPLAFESYHGGRFPLGLECLIELFTLRDRCPEIHDSSHQHGRCGHVAHIADGRAPDVFCRVFPRELLEISVPAEVVTIYFTWEAEPINNRAVR